MNWPVQVTLRDQSENGRRDAATLRMRPLHRRDVWKAAGALARIAEEGVYVGAENVNVGQTADRYLVTMKKHRYLYLVAEIDDDFAGLGSARPGPFGHKDEHVATLSIWLLPWARGRGAGTYVMRTLLDWCREVGYEKAELGVFSNNQPALRLYRRLGFEVEVRQRRAIKLPTGEYVDNLIMGTFL